jgi:hypothetical protein
MDTLTPTNIFDSEPTNSKFVQVSLNSSNNDTESSEIFGDIKTLFQDAETPTTSKNVKPPSHSFQNGRKSYNLRPNPPQKNLQDFQYF